MRRRPPRSTRSDTLFPTRRSSDLARRSITWLAVPACGETRHHSNLCKARQTDAKNANQSSIARWPIDYGAFQAHDIPAYGDRSGARSEEHTSELQSLMRISYAVFCLQKKKTTHTKSTQSHHSHSPHKQI